MDTIASLPANEQQQQRAIAGGAAALGATLANALPFGHVFGAATLIFRGQLGNVGAGTLQQCVSLSFPICGKVHPPLPLPDGIANVKSKLPYKSELYHPVLYDAHNTPLHALQSGFHITGWLADMQEAGNPLRSPNRAPIRFCNVEVAQLSSNA